MFYYATLGTNDADRARRFYEPTLATLGLVLLEVGAEECSFGAPGGADPVLFVCKPYDTSKPASYGNGAMLALTAPTREAVTAFHTAALANGGSDEGLPGLRPYAPNFYACYVRDPDGNKLSAVCIRPE